MTTTGAPAGPAAPEAQAGSVFLAEASRLLADSLDYETTLATVAGLSLPYLGAWCIVDICVNGDMRRAAVIHSDTRMQGLARKLEAGWPPERDDPFGVPRAVRTRQTEIVAHIPDEMLVEVSRGEENLQVLRELGMGSLLVVPLLARGEVLGAITYVSPREGRTHGDEDVALAEDLAARCAIALDNARLYRTATDAQRKAERASAVKSEFLAMLSHELRTPLTGVISYAELLEGEVLGSLTAKQKEACARIKANSWHLVSIIEEILTLSQAEAGRLEVHREETDVLAIVREVVRILEPRVEKGVTLQLECADQEARLRTDARKVRQILLNLIGNATKFTTEGRITVSVEDADATAQKLRIHVHDTGPGIATEEQEQIFEPFTRASQKQSGGTGLGLSISRKLALVLGGDITVHSAPGEGSTFTLHLPSPGSGER